MADESKTGAAAADVGNQAWHFASYPDPMVTTDNMKLVDVDMPTEVSEDGNVLLRTNFISVDPYMRGRMKKGGSGYAAGFAIDAPMNGFTVCTVIKSKSEDLKEGDLVHGYFPWIRVFETAAGGCRKLDMSRMGGASPSLFLGVLGLTGLSAYFPALDIGEPKEGDVVFVSGAAGAVGSVAGQIFKLKGCKVIGCAGSDEKVAFVKSLGFDAAFNYKTADAGEALKEFSEEGIDIYWDNVGGPMLDLALERMKSKGRIIACGAISQYNKTYETRYGLKNMMNVIKKEVKVQGFLLGSYLSRAGEGVAALAGWLAEGKIKSKETVSEGFETVAESLVGLFSGKNTGKMIVKV